MNTRTFANLFNFIHFLAAIRSEAIGINKALDTQYNKLCSDYKGLLHSIIGVTDSNTNLQG